MKDGYHTGHCTYPFCKRFIKNGDGVQVMNPKTREFDRYCNKHWTKYNQRIEQRVA
jgi:hypothetical protein